MSNPSYRVVKDDGKQVTLEETFDLTSPDGPEPVRFGPYVIHAIGSTIWLTPACNSETQVKTRQ